MDVTRRPRNRSKSTVFTRRKHVAPATPITFWKLFSYENRSTSGMVESARKLAAGLWKLQLAAGCPGLNLKCGSSDVLDAEPGIWSLNTTFPSRRPARKYGAESSDLLRTSQFVSSTKNGIYWKAMEGATKWEPRCSTIFNEVYCFYGHMELLQDKITTESVASPIQAELVQAQLHIRELEEGQRSFQKTIKHLLKMLGEERTSWQRREQDKIHDVIDDLKNELRRERKKYKRTEILNAKLVSELKVVKLSAKQLRKDYEKEKKCGELMEEVCKELKNEIAAHAAKFESLKMEFIRILEEVEEERKMLQIIELWREERTQMKLVDAKLALEDKYCQMNKLIADLEAFIRSGNGTLNVRKLRELELIRQAANSINIKDIKEFSYVPPNSSDIYSIFEEVMQIEADEKATEQCSKHSPESDVSKFRTASSVANHCNNQHLSNQSNISITTNSQYQEDAIDWESVTCTKDQASSYSPAKSDPFVNTLSKVRQNARECKKTPNAQMSRVCSVSAEQSLQKIRSISKLSGSSLSNGRYSKIISYDDGNRRLSNDTKFSPRDNFFEKELE